MAYSDVANNQTVSLNNLKDAVASMIFLQLNTIPSGNKQITKSEAAYYVNCSTSYAPYAAKSSGQLVVKSDLVGRVVIPIELTTDQSNAGTLKIYSKSSTASTYTLQTTLTGVVGSPVTYEVSLLNTDMFYCEIEHTARQTSGQRGQIIQTVDGVTTAFVTSTGTLPKSKESDRLTLSHLSIYDIKAYLGSQV
jgi:hypothetical protein